MLQSHWSLLHLPKKFNFVDHTVSHREACTGGARDYMLAERQIAGVKGHVSIVPDHVVAECTH